MSQCTSLVNAVSEKCQRGGGNPRWLEMPDVDSLERTGGGIRASLADV